MAEIKIDEIKLVNINDLKPNPNNRNIHPKKQIEQLAKHYEYHGIRTPIIVSNRSGLIVAGHGRLEAAIKADLKFVPVSFQDFDSDEQEYSYGIADNGLGLWSDLDLKQINLDIVDLGPDFDINMLGIDGFTLDFSEKGQCDEDHVPEIGKSISKTGDLYILGNHKLFCGDSSLKENVDFLMNGEKIDMIFTDPPYGVNYQNKNILLNVLSQNGGLETPIAGDDLPLVELKELLLKVFKNYDFILKDKSSYYICSPQGGELGMMMMMMMMQESNLICRHMIIWVKNAPVFSLGRLDYDYQHEPILYGWSKNRTHNKIMNGEFKTSVWKVNRENNDKHPTMKPVILPENAIRNSCPQSGNVADFFGGSGSTLIACEKTKRNCYMMEIDQHYCDVIVSRYCEFVGNYNIIRNNEPMLWPKTEREKQ